MTQSISDILKPRIKPNIFVAVPSCRDWKFDFGTSMVNFVSYLTAKFYKGEIEGLIIRCQVASLLPLGREMLVRQALETKATHILWIDDDTKFPHEVIDSLLSRNVDYIAANMCRKQYPLVNTAHDQNGKPVDSTGKTGIQEVFHVGLGMCLINLDVLRNIPAPLFEVKWLDHLNTYQGEDMYLCDKLRANGVKMYIDHDVSNVIGHVGDHSYGFHSLQKKKEAA